MTDEPAPSHARNSRHDQRVTRPLTPGEALEKLFLDNADRGANAANDELVAALRQRARAIQALANMITPHPPLPETTTPE